MSSDVSNCMSIVVADSSVGAKRAPIRDLRLEILQLRRQLKASETAALKHAVTLREGDHRIKNSLQLVASLMRLQARRESSGPVRTALRTAAARVSNVAGIHDALQKTRGLDRVDLGATLRKMCASLQAMAGDTDNIQVVVDAEKLEIPVAVAQPITLAVNELVVNALRHAFPDTSNGSVRVGLRRTDTGLSITVADNGIGLPLNHSSGQGYGTSLVGMMVKQIGGTLETESVAGSRFTIHAPLNPV